MNPFSLISPAYAQDVSGILGSATQFAPLVLIFAVFYFLLIRPQQQKQKENFLKNTVVQKLTLAHQKDKLRFLLIVSTSLPNTFRKILKTLAPNVPW